MKASIRTCLFLSLLALSGSLTAAPASVGEAGAPAGAPGSAQPFDGMKAAEPLDPESVADTHLQLQYALHRASRSLYNPAAGLLMAGVPAEADTLGHVAQ